MSRQRLVRSLFYALGLVSCWGLERAAAQVPSPPPPPPVPVAVGGGSSSPTLGSPIPVQMPPLNNFGQSQPGTNGNLQPAALQPPPPPPPPGPVWQAPPNGTPPYTYPPPPPPPPPGNFVPNPLAPPPLVSDWTLGRPQGPPPGFFTALEVGLVGPHVKNDLAGNVTFVAGHPTTVTVPTASLDWTGSPRVTLGYQLADNQGQLLLSYRSLVSQGSDNITRFDAFGTGFLHSRLNMNTIDLDYASCPLQFAPYWHMNWDVGVRLAGAYFSSTAEGAQLTQQVANNFLGAGPRGAIDLGRALPELPGMSVFGRLEGTVLIGDINQSFEQTYSNGSGTPLFGAASRVNSAQAVPVLGFRTGLDYVPPVQGHWMRFSVGYEFEYWWNVGNAGLSSSREDISWQGIFFRGEFSF